MKTVDALLIGRKTYEVMLASGQSSYPGLRNYVFSRSAKKVGQLKKFLAARQKPDKNVEIVNGEAATFVQKLKPQKGKGIVVFGGGKLAQALLEAEVIDEIVLNIQPVLLGSGIPLFYPMKQQIDLKLTQFAGFEEWRADRRLSCEALTSIRTEEQYISMHFFTP